MLTHGVLYGCVVLCGVCALEPHFFGTCRLSAPCGSSRRFDFRSVDPAGSFVRSRDPLETMILESHERCCQVVLMPGYFKRENDAWELHRSYFSRPRFKPSLAPPLANIIFIGWDPKIRGLMTLPTMTNVSLKLWFVNRCCSCKKYQHLFGH